MTSLESSRLFYLVLDDFCTFRFAKSVLFDLPIINILDKFTALTAELQAELQARRQQYEYYHNRLLSFDGYDNIHSKLTDTNTITPPQQNMLKWLKISEVCTKVETYKWGTEDSRFYIDLSCVDMNKHTIINPITITKTNAPSRAKQKIIKDDILFATTRPTQLRSCLIPEEYDGHICSTGYCVLRVDQSIVTPKWIYYNINTSTFLKHIERNETKSGSYPAISDKTVKDYLISIPPLTEQQRIVAILDKFEKLVNDISDGLPAEIAARRQQYEYYRDKLLTFKKAAS